MLYVSKVKLPGQGRCSGSGHCCNSVHPEWMRAAGIRFLRFPHEEGAAQGRLLPQLPGVAWLVVASLFSLFRPCLSSCLKAVLSLDSPWSALSSLQLDYVIVDPIFRGEHSPWFGSPQGTLLT